MGKTVHYHPMSLHVIRGAAEYCGWKFKKITWIHGRAETKRAAYMCEIDQMPRGAVDWPIRTIKDQLQHCFMDDITVDSVWCRPDGRWLCHIVVDLNGEATTAEKYDGEL
jgi:hypothetical protein